MIICFIIIFLYQFYFPIVLQFHHDAPKRWGFSGLTKPAFKIYSTIRNKEFTPPTNTNYLALFLFAGYKV